MNDKRQYEQACLEVVRDDLLGSETLKRDGTVIHDVRLEGSHPDTRLIVDVEYMGKRAELDWRLWGDDFGEVPEGAPPYPPEGVAQDVFVQVIEFQ